MSRCPKNRGSDVQINVGVKRRPSASARAETRENSRDGGPAFATSSVSSAISWAVPYTASAVSSAAVPTMLLAEGVCRLSG